MKSAQSKEEMRRSRKKGTRGGKNSKERGSGKLQEQGKNQKEDTTKTSNQPNKNQQGGNGKNEDQNQSRTQQTGQQQKKNIQSQEEQGQQEEIQEEQWQVQKRKHQKTQEQDTSKSVWRHVTPPMQRNSGSHQQEQGNAGKARKATNRAGWNQGNSKKTPRQQVIDSNKNRNSGIGLTLPNPKTPNIINVDAGHNEEVSGGMDGGCQEIATNMQEGDTKGGNLTHVMHEGLDFDPRTNHRASNNAKNTQKQKEQQLQQQTQNSDNSKQIAKGNIEEQHFEKRNDKDQGKQSVTMVTDSTPKSKNKPSKQKRDAAKKRQNRLQDKDSEQEQEVREESCNKFVMVDDNQGLNILPLQVQYMTPQTSDPHDKMQQRCRVNPEPILDEYVVVNSEDELVGL
ncbi:transcription factor SPT20 homolog [Solanum pennellii]|uniref:Transcription factor SPT20 homolog n=1 Tax=Solanum pennellii TaxID=28526 RepID=A0ABM1GSU1_SOLPN|nr:transcription factor SPT20 homolog [Solanum pennellii]